MQRAASATQLHSARSATQTGAMSEAETGKTRDPPDRRRPSSASATVAAAPARMAPGRRRRSAYDAAGMIARNVAIRRGWARSS